MPLSLLFVLAVGAITEFAVYRPLRNSSPLAKLVSSLGVLLIAQSAMILAFGVTPQPEPGILPTNVVHILGAVVPVDRFILTGLVIVAAAGLGALYKWTRFGLATRAAAENEAAAMLGGLSPNVISLANTLLASLVAGALGILAASITQLDPQTLPLQIIPALAAALIASFTSFGIAAGASFGIAIMYSLLQYASAQSWFPQSGGVSLPGVTDLLAFGIIVVVLFWRGSRIPGRGEIVERRLPEAPRPQHLVRTGLICALVGAVLLIVFPFDFREALINTLIGALMALSLVVVTGFVGQISVIQLALAGAAGFTISHMAVNFGITFPVAALAGIAVAVVIGLITAISAVRVRGVSLSVVTLAGAVAIENFGFVNSTWGGGLAGSPVPEPRWFGLNLGPNAPFRGIDGNQPSPVFGWVALICCVLLMVAVGYIRRGKLGQRMLAVRSNERAAAAAAINPRTVKLYAFGIAAGIAGVGGVLYAYNFGSVSADRFDAVTALSLIAFAYVGGITLISGAVFAGLLSAQALIPYALDKWFGLNGNWFLLVGGVLLIFTLLANPEGVAGDFYRRTHKRPVLHAPDVATAVAAGPARARPPSRVPGRRPGRHVRRRARAQRRQPGGPRGRTGRPDRPERRGQDHAGGRRLRLRGQHRTGGTGRGGPRRAPAVRAGPPRAGPHLAEHGTVRGPGRAGEPDRGGQGRGGPRRVGCANAGPGRHGLGGRGHAEPVVHGPAQAGRGGPGPGRPAAAAVPGRARRGPGHAGEPGTRRLPARPGRPGPVDAPDRARHGAGAGHLRPGGRARVRPGHRRRPRRERGQRGRSRAIARE